MEMPGKYFWQAFGTKIKKYTFGNAWEILLAKFQKQNQNIYLWEGLGNTFGKKSEAKSKYIPLVAKSRKQNQNIYLWEGLGNNFGKLSEAKYKCIPFGNAWEMFG